ALQLDDGRSLHESSTICEYLDDIVARPPLRPADPYQLATMRNFVRWTDEKALPRLLILNWSIALQPAASQWTDKELEERLARIPTAERREAWIRIARQPYTEAEKAEALRGLLQLTDRMEAMLGEGDREWLMGAQYTLADVAAAPFVARIAELAPDTVGEAPGGQADARRRDAGPRGGDASHPRVAAWWSRLQQRPAFAQARIERFDMVLARRAAQAGATSRPS